MSMFDHANDSVKLPSAYGIAELATGRLYVC